MSLFRRPLFRFFVWAIVLVGLAVGTGMAGLAWWLIALVELAAWSAVTLAERTLWRRTVVAPVASTQETAPKVAVPKIAALPDVAPPEGEPEPLFEPVAAPAPEPPRRRVMRAPVRIGAGKTAGARLPNEVVRWNVWSLERIARDTPDADELEFLVLSLREFADSHGQLPPGFDPLVRESFGDLLLG